jgi:alpha-tubulin suppressor-like RCC1 family protein
MKLFRLLAIVALALVFAAPSFAKSVSRARLISWPNPSKLGQPAVLLAEIDGLGGGAPKGIVTFTEGDAVLGSRPINPYGAGQATLAAGFWHSCALTAAGGIKCWGGNIYGQLGDGTITDAIAVVAGADHSCALTRTGAVKCWGANYNGQLGDGTSSPTSAPVDVIGLRSGVVAIAAAGANHSCALTRGGAVKCWGDNMRGELGDGTMTESHAPVAVLGLSSGIVAITAGYDHSCALTKGGAVKCWGFNRSGALGDGTTTDRHAPVDVVGLRGGVVAISMSGSHTCALISGGTVKCWGAGGALTPVSVSGLSNVAAISAGDGHSCALTRDGAVKCWGKNWNGQVGDGTTTNRLTPVSVSGLSNVAAISASGDYTCAVTRDGAVKCWGSNGNGQLGDGTTTDRHTPVTVSGFTALVRSRTWISTRTLGVGAHALRASYRGDSFHGGSSIRYGHAVE